MKAVGIRFNNKGRMYYFNTHNLKLAKNMKVLVETERGEQIGDVYLEEKEINPEVLVNPLKDVIRITTLKDIKIYEKNLQDSNKALITAKKIASDLNLNMKILDASFTFDKKQLLFSLPNKVSFEFMKIPKSKYLI